MGLLGGANEWQNDWKKRSGSNSGGEKKEEEVVFYADHALIGGAELGLPSENQCKVSAMAGDSAGATKGTCGGVADPGDAECAGGYRYAEVNWVLQ